MGGVRGVDFLGFCDKIMKQRRRVLVLYLELVEGMGSGEKIKKKKFSLNCLV